MAGYEQFDRQYRIGAGPAGKPGFEIGETSTDCPVPLHIEFSFEKSDLETQNTGKLKIWNLSSEHLAVLNQKDCALYLRAGYNKNLSLIFAGIVSYVRTTMDGGDMRTEIELVDNLIQIRDTYVSVAYKGTVNWKTIIDDTAAQMGVAVSYAKDVAFTTMTNGYSYVGQGKNILDKACSSCGLSWSIQNGVLEVLKKGGTMGTEGYLLSEATGLVNIPARISIELENESGEGEAQKVLGWEVAYLMNGAINVNDLVRLESKYVKGYFRVHKITVDGDNFSGDWACSAELLEV